MLVHGRSADKVARARASLHGADHDGFVADLSDLDAVAGLADAVGPVDVLVNNAGVFHTPEPRTATGLDVRFVVNTLAPVLLTRRLLPSIPKDGRVVNQSSAAQEPVSLPALRGEVALAPFAAYAQSKLALTAWSGHLGASLPDGPVVVAVNPGSMLASKMVREGFGVPGRDLGVGVDILVKAALSPAFADASGRYFDNDNARFARPHPDAVDPDRVRAVLQAIDALL